MGKLKAKTKLPKPSFKTKPVQSKIKKKSFNKTKVSKFVKKNKVVKGKVNFSSMSVDDFMNNFDVSEESSIEPVEVAKKLSNEVLPHSTNSNNVVKRAGKIKERTKNFAKRKETVAEDDEQVEDTNLWGDAEEDLAGNNSSNYDNEIVSHKVSLEKLKKTDPEFYKFLEDNDQKLLEFNISDSEEEQDNEDEQIHKPLGDLEIGSDESDFEPDHDERTDSERERTVTLRMLKNWQVSLQTDKSNKTITCVVDAFHAALLRVTNEENEMSRFKVDGSSVFNGVIQLCVLELSPAIRRFLGLSASKKTMPHKCKKFIKIKKQLQSYFTDLLKLLSGVTSTNILTVLLKHLHHMSLLLVSFPNLSKPLVKKLIHLWGTGEEVVRVLAFFCILRITNSQLGNLLDTVLKSMYITYVINSKFVSVSTLSSINFMRRSLVEMFALDPAVSYQYIFLYIRQLAIHLRNAITVHRKENIQSVYNWQFINSLKLWSSLLRVTYDKPQLQSLVYPFVQVCLGTIKLVGTAQYYPLRFHIVQMLIEFSRDTSVFIPILPFILDVLNTYDFNKKHKKASTKLMNFTCLLRLSNSQLSEHGFKDGVIDHIYGLLLEYLASQSHSLAFPDLSLICVFQIKQFIGTCKIANYNKKLKQVIDKIKQNNDFIENERKAISFNLNDFDKIDSWERMVKNKGTPLNNFYESWNKLRTIKKNKQATNNDKIGDYNLPVIKKIKKGKDGDTKSAKKQQFDPFPSDSDSDIPVNFHDDEDEKSKKQTRKRKKKNVKVMQNNFNSKDEDETFGEHQEDIVQDFNISDW